MDEKLNIQDLAALLAERNGMEKGKAYNFVREFFALIEDALAKDKYVKIKGLGVFKLIDVEPRESVNIQTKERFEIPGYTKISFTPENALKETINQPFALFETVALNENTISEEKKKEVVGEEPTVKKKEKESDMLRTSAGEPEFPQQYFDSSIPRKRLWQVFGIALAIALLAVIAFSIILFVYV